MRAPCGKGNAGNPLNLARKPSLAAQTKVIIRMAGPAIPAVGGAKEKSGRRFGVCWGEGARTRNGDCLNRRCSGSRRLQSASHGRTFFCLTVRERAGAVIPGSPVAQGGAVPSAGPRAGLGVEGNGGTSPASPHPPRAGLWCHRSGALLVFSHSRRGRECGRPWRPAGAQARLQPLREGTRTPAEYRHRRAPPFTTACGHGRPGFLRPSQSAIAVPGPPGPRVAGKTRVAVR